MLFSWIIDKPFQSIPSIFSRLYRNLQIPLITIFKFTFSGRGSLMVMICLQNVKQAKFLIAWYALFDCNSTAFFLLALAITWNFFFIFQIQFSSLLPFIVIHSRHPSYLNKRQKRTDSFDNFELYVVDDGLR